MAFISSIKNVSNRCITHFYFLNFAIIKSKGHSPDAAFITSVGRHLHNLVNDSLESSNPSLHDSNKIKVGQLQPVESIDIVNFDSITSADLSVIQKSEAGVLESCKEDVSDIAPFSSPSFNLASYANQSRTIQELVKIGVDLYRLEHQKGAAESILKLDFEKHVKPHLRFLHDLGIAAEEFGNFITKNPFIFEHNLDDLQVRINYLVAKKFSADGILRIVSKNPKWLNYSTIEIDKRLGFFQRTFVLSGDEVRYLAVKKPKLITYTAVKVLNSLFAVKEDMGFNEREIKALLLKKPKLYDIQTTALKERFDYVHNIMGISHEQVLKQPGVLLFRNFIVKQRHEFLKLIGKAQYNHKMPGYVSLDALVHGDDVEFCKNVAKTSIDVFNAFLKSS